jgi:hypothetical protein
MDRLNHISLGWLYVAAVTAGALGSLIGWLYSKPGRRT